VGRYRELTPTEIKELNTLIEPSSKTEEASLPKEEPTQRISAARRPLNPNRPQTRNNGPAKPLNTNRRPNPRRDD
jgi:23S rRNA pseudouridine2604 synthase